MKNPNRWLCLSLLFISGPLGCSANSWFSVPSAIGAAGGAVAGVAVGKQLGYNTTNAGLVGAGAGLLAGAAFSEYDAYQSQPVVTIRKPDLSEVSSVQADVRTEQAAVDATKYGRAETEPWDDRYVGSNANVPYQGTAPQYQNFVH